MDDNGKKRIREIDVRLNGLDATRDSWSAAEVAEVERLSAELSSLKARRDDDGPPVRKVGPTDPGRFAGPSAWTSNRIASSEGCSAVWKDRRTGRDVVVAGLPFRFAAADEHAEKRASFGRYPIGDLIRAAITGRGDDLAPEISAALSTGVNSAGGVLVPTILAPTFIDLARAKSVLMEAGAQTFVMDSDRVEIARLATDPTLQVKVENAAFSGTDPTFDAIGMTAYTIGNVITMSRELAEDAPNGSQIIQDVFMRAAGVAIDRYGLQGTASAQPAGLTVRLTPTTGAASIDFDELLDSVGRVWAANHEPVAYILHPTLATALAKTKSGDGTNSAALYMTAPDEVAALMNLRTTNMPTDALFCGDFSHYLFGVRSQIRIEVSTEAGEAFERHQVKIKLVWRGDFGLTQSAAIDYRSDLTA